MECTALFWYVWKKLQCIHIHIINKSKWSFSRKDLLITTKLTLEVILLYVSHIFPCASISGMPREKYNVSSMPFLCCLTQSSIFLCDRYYPHFITMETGCKTIISPKVIQEENHIIKMQNLVCLHLLTSEFFAVGDVFPTHITLESAKV